MPHLETPPPVRYAEKIKKTEFAGVSSIVQLVGAIALFVFPIGTVAGIILIIIGSNMSQRYTCSECAEKVEKAARRCRHCGAHFEDA
jgi:hypothetical protein